ncbi:MAG: adenylate/guanylate cyclase domain-containing protein, partial [Spirochaetaceae bacterium]
MAVDAQGKKKKRKKSKLLETRYFGFIIATFIILLFLALSEFTAIIDNLEVKILDVHFRYKDIMQSEEIQEGVQVVRQNPHISSDILIV